jgi:secreted trypsin-like serine protease
MTIDKTGALRLIGAMLRRLATALACWLCFAAPTSALVGGAAPDNKTPRHAVMIVGSHGTFCTGTAIARDLILTAAHCVQPGSDYKFLDYDAAKQPLLRDIAKIAIHPQFSLQTLFAHRATADVALLKLAQPLPASVTAAPLVAPRAPVAVGESFVVLGYGLTIRGDGKTGGTLRRATLVATGQPGNLQIRLVDPTTQGERAGLGACTGDSGAPLFSETAGQLSIIGVVSWSTGPKAGDGCGGLTGVTPLELYRGWIAETARKMGSPIAP